MNAYLNVMRKYATFSGRATRTEFWLFFLFVMIGAIITITIDVGAGFADEGVLAFTGIWNLIHILPSLAVSVRRLHDTDKSGWWMLLVFTGIGQFVLLVFYFLESNSGANSFGANPHNPNAPQGLAGGIESPQGIYLAQGQQAVANTHQQATGSAIEQIEKLTSLHKDGAIDDEEFTRMKADLLKKDA